jgi:adenosylhomocysteine nucleosidase
MSNNDIAYIWCLVAMQEEVFALFGQENVCLLQAKPFEIYELKQQNIRILRTGIGNTNAAAATQYLLTKHTPEIIYNLGSAGGLSENVALKQAYCIEKSMFFDVDVSAFGYAYGQIPQNGLTHYVLQANTGITCASGNSFVENFQEKYATKITPKIDLVEMELAGILHTLHVNEYKGVIKAIKGISDHANHHAKNEFTENLQLAMQAVKNIFEKDHAN